MSMCVYIYVFIDVCVYMYVHMCVCVYMYAYVCVHIYVHVHMYIYMSGGIKSCSFCSICNIFYLAFYFTSLDFLVLIAYVLLFHCISSVILLVVTLIIILLLVTSEISKGIHNLLPCTLNQMRSSIMYNICFNSI